MCSKCITGISQSLWANRTLTAVVGSDTVTVTVTERYQTPLSWTAGYDNRNRLAQFDRAGSETRYTYDPNSNRLTALDKTTADTDLNGEFDQADFSLSTGQTLNIAANSNRLLGLTQSFTKVRGTKTLSIVNCH